MIGNVFLYQGCADSGPNLIDLARTLNLLEFYGLHLKKMMNVLHKTEGCSHGRAPIYFTESINSNVAFRATACTSYANFQSGSCNNNAKANMGYPVPTT